MKINFNLLKIFLIINILLITPSNSYLAVYLSETGINEVILRRQEVMKSLKEEGTIPFNLARELVSRTTDGPLQMISLIDDVHQDFHMTLQDDIKSKKDMEGLVAAFKLIEFKVDSISIMGKFITLCFHPYTLRKNDTRLSDRQLALLQKYIPYRPHMSLYKITDKVTLENSIADETYGPVQEVNITKKDEHKKNLIETWKDLLNSKSPSLFKQALISKFKKSIQDNQRKDQSWEWSFIQNLESSTATEQDIKKMKQPFLNKFDKLSQGLKKIYHKYKEENWFSKFKNIEKYINFLLDAHGASTTKQNEKKEIETIYEEIISTCAKIATETTPSEIRKPVPLQNNPSPFTPEQIKKIMDELHNKYSGLILQFEFPQS